MEFLWRLNEMMCRQGLLDQFLALSTTIATAILLETRLSGTKRSLLQTNVPGPLGILHLKHFPDLLLFWFFFPDTDAGVLSNLSIIS